MHSRVLVSAVVLLLGMIGSVAADAQSVPFERTFSAAAGQTVDVTTIRGKVEVVAGAPGRVDVRGAATVRAGWDVPADALEIARKVAAHPPIQQEGAMLRLTPPSSDAERRALTISYRIAVPPDTVVTTKSDSGAVAVHGVRGSVTVRTQSGAIELGQLGSGANVTTGSGDVSVKDIAGALRVTTSSSGLSATGLKGGLHARTQSGAVDASFAGAADADIETGSSAIQIRDLRGGLAATTQSGQVTVAGVPAVEWNIKTGSGRVDVTPASTSFDVDLTSRSGSAQVRGSAVEGTNEKRRVQGKVGSGGVPIRVSSQSGAITIAATR